jgi:16S rRNA processing protein RimM
MRRPARVELGRVVGAHGLAGEIRVSFFGDGPGNLVRASAVRLGADADDPHSRRLTVERARPGRTGEVRMALEGIHSREAAQALGGLLVIADAAELEALPPGEHYWYELVGCRVEAAGGQAVGIVRELWNPGAHDVLVVERGDGRDVLIPAVPEFLREVDVGEGRVVVEAIPGLLEPA